MTVKFVCQKCGKETEVDMHYDKDLDGQTFSCQHCGGKHIQVAIAPAPGAPVDLQFRLVEA